MSPYQVASRNRSALSICAALVLAGATLFALPAAAWATPLDGTGTVTDTVEDTLPDTGGVTQPIEDTIEDTLPDTGGVTQPIEDTVEDTLPDTGGTTDPIDDLTGTVEETAGSVDGGTLDGTTDTVTGPVVDSIDKTVIDNSADSPKGDRKTQKQGGSGGFGARTLDERFPHEFSSASPSAANPERILQIAPASTPAPPGPGLIERIAQAALDAAKKVAFPIALMLAAGAFMVLQGRFDRRDPKLATAPVEIDEQLLRFE